MGVVDGDGCVGVFIGWVGLESVEGGGAVDGEPANGIVDGDFDVFGEDEVVECVSGRLGEVAVEFDEGAVIAFDDAEVGVDSALAVEPEAELGLSGLEIVNFGSEHVVEKLVALGAGNFEGGHVGFVEDDGGFAECGVFHVELAEGFDDLGRGFWGAVGDEEGFGGLVDGLEWVCRGHTLRS